MINALKKEFRREIEAHDIPGLPRIREAMSNLQSNDIHFQELTPKKVKTAISNLFKNKSKQMQLSY